MFRRNVIVAVTLLLITTIVSICLLFRFSPKDQEKYQNLVQATQGDPRKVSEIPFSGNQEREEIQKSIWYTDNKTNQRLNFWIDSRSSEMHFEIDSNGQQQILEDLKDVHCYMQEELYYQLPDGQEVVRTNDTHGYLRHDATRTLVPLSERDLQPVQIIRNILADNATYNYTSCLFTANKIFITRYKIHGHTLTKALEEGILLMKGTATSIDFTLQGSSLDFHAHHLKGTLYEIEGNWL